MNKQENKKARYYVQWDSHAKHICSMLCSLMEHQGLVDVAICCGTNTIHAHKIVLAANSPYFREQLEKNAGTEQIVISGLDFSIIKSIIEFMYCGETNILDENLKYMIAAARFFQMQGLQSLVFDNNNDVGYDADSIHITPPLFLSKKPKYSSAYRPLGNIAAPTGLNSFKPQIQNDPYSHRKMKRKFVRSEAERACAKEAAASRLALEALQKELAATPMSSFVIDESGTGTTVENFIPHTEQTFIENINNIGGVPLQMQMVNLDQLNHSILSAGQVINIGKPECSNATLQFGMESNQNKDKLKHSLESNNLPESIEIMYRTNDGNFVNVTSDVLQNMSAQGLQYQIIDEHGQIRELREFQTENHTSDQTSFETDHTVCIDNSLNQHCVNQNNLEEDKNEKYISCTDFDMINTNNLMQNNAIDSKTEAIENHFNQSQLKSMPQIIDDTSNEEVILKNNGSTSNTTVSNATLYERSTVPAEHDLYKESSIDAEENSSLNNYSINEFLNTPDIAENNKQGAEGTKPTDPFMSENTSTYQSDEITFEWVDPEKLDDNHKDKQETNITAMNLYNENVLNNCVFYDEGGSGDCKIDFKKSKLKRGRNVKPDCNTVSVDRESVTVNSQDFEESSSQKKTRSTLKTEDNTECFDSINTEHSSIKYEKPRRMMSNRRKKF